MNTMIVLLNLVSFTAIYTKKKTIEINRIIYRLNNGLIDLLFQTNLNVIKNHLIFSFAFSDFYEYYKKGRGKVYITQTRLQKSSLIGFITGIIYCSFS